MDADMDGMCDEMPMMDEDDELEDMMPQVRLFP